MIEFNWKRILIMICICILLTAFSIVVVASAVKYDDSNDLIAPMSNSTSGSYEVHQRDTVYWGDTVDLSLVSGWYCKFIHADSEQVVDACSFTKKIYIDPNIFEPGEWDQWSDFDEGHGMTIAFYVKKYKPSVDLDNVTPVETPNVTVLKPYIQPIPVKKVTDILIARGDPLDISFKKAKIWIFGVKSGYYDFNTDKNNSIYLNKSVIQNLEPGNYVLVAEMYSNKTDSANMRFDAKNDSLQYFDPVTFKIVTVSFAGLDPQTRLAKFRSVRNISQDNFNEYKMVVQDPYIEIMSLDQSYINDTTFAQTVRGYTNTATGTLLTFQIDKDTARRFNLFYTNAKGSGNPGEMRWFEITIPLLWENFVAGHHSITGTTATGGSVTVDFNVYESPEHSFIPNNTIKYVNGSEWRPDPTPIIVTEVVTKEIVKVVTKEIPVPPSQASVDAGAYAANVKMATLIVTGLAVIGVGLFAFWYSRRVYCKWRDRKQEQRRGRGGF